MKWANKNKIILIFTMLHFFKQNTCRYHYQNLNDMIYSSWDRAKHAEIGSFRSFFALLPPKALKNKNFEKWKNWLDISSFYTCAPKITIICCMVPEIWSETGRIFLSFGSFFALLIPTHFLMIPKIKFWKTKKKMPGDIILLYMHICVP